MSIRKQKTLFKYVKESLPSVLLKFKNSPGADLSDYWDSIKCPYSENLYNLNIVSNNDSSYSVCIQGVILNESGDYKHTDENYKLFNIDSNGYILKEYTS